MAHAEVGGARLVRLHVALFIVVSLFFIVRVSLNPITDVVILFYNFVALGGVVVDMSVCVCGGPWSWIYPPPPLPQGEGFPSRPQYLPSF